MKEKKIIEFMKIETLNKFNHNSNITFLDGHFTANWFTTYKDRILDSNDENCKVIQKQYQQYLKQIKDKKREVSDASLKRTIKSFEVAKEFMNIEDMGKFDIDSKIMLSNGMSSYEWFSKNIRYVTSSPNEIYQTIQKQYYDTRLKNKMINFRKDRYYFYKEKKLYKFNENSDVKLPSNTLSGIWFLENKDIILKSNNPINIEIKAQYEIYQNYYALVSEFYNEKNVLKFDSSSNIRFGSGALMNFWWEDNKEKILSSTFFLDNLIKKQYNKYIDANEEEVFKKKL